MSLDWLRICSNGQTENCVQPEQAAYLFVLLLGVVILLVASSRARDLSVATISLMPIAVAINIAVGSIVNYLKLPIYLDSIGTVLVGALAGPWAGAMTGMIANLLWAILPVPGGGGPTIAFFAPVAGIIGLMAGFWARQGVFRLRREDPRVGSFLALAAGVAAAGLFFLLIQATLGVPNVGGTTDEQLRFVVMGVGVLLFGAVVAVAARQTIFAFRPGDARIVPSLVAATAIAAGLFVLALIRLLFAPSGYFSTIKGDPNVLNGANLSGLAAPDPEGLYAAVAIGVVVGLVAALWASRGENSRLFPVWIGGFTTGLVAATMSAPIAAGVFGGVTGAGTDYLVALFRTLGLNVFQSAFAQGLTSDPFDKTLSYTVVFAILAALPITVRTMFSRGEATIEE